MKQIPLILVGGFLGAGKTTLLARAARLLSASGKRAGLIANDQAAHLVDSEVLGQEEAGVTEVTGGCFCCRFDDLVSAADHLVETHQPDVLLGEAVGSCTDISATVLQPLKKYQKERFLLAPFSVLVDPFRLEAACGSPAESPFPDSVLYIFRKQIEEADLIVLNKTDLLSPSELAHFEGLIGREFPGKTLLPMSAVNAEGVAEWLGHVLDGRPSGGHIAEVDYDIYAQGEAALGWLNATVRLVPHGEPDWRLYCLDLIERMRGRLRLRSAEIAHVKIYLTAKGGSLQANLTSTSGVPLLFTGKGKGEDHIGAEMVLNARVHIGPEELAGIVKECLGERSAVPVEAEILHLASFSPGRPQPTYRMGTVV
jgi:Ni2+-binding GTPase involved in maturation of urease and hydrogenase